MSDTKILCVLAGYDAQTESHLAGIQQSLYDAGFEGTQTKDIFMHITLGTFAPDDEEMLIARMKEAAESASFELTFNHIGIFGGSRVLFIAPTPNHELLHLKENFGSSTDWTAHTTMLIDAPEVIFRAVPVVSEHFRAFRGRVTSLHLYEFWPTRHIFSIDLGTERT